MKRCAIPSAPVEIVFKCFLISVIVSTPVWGLKFFVTSLVLFMPCWFGCFLFVGKYTDFYKEDIKVFYIWLIEFREMFVYCFLLGTSVLINQFPCFGRTVSKFNERTFEIICFRTVDECFHITLLVFIFSLKGGVRSVYLESFMSVISINYGSLSPMALIYPRVGKALYYCRFNRSTSIYTVLYLSVNIISKIF